MRTRARCGWLRVGKWRLAIFLTTFLSTLAPSFADQAMPFGEADVQLLIRHVVPLPKKIEVIGLATLPGDELVLFMPARSSAILGQLEADWQKTFVGAYGVNIKITRTDALFRHIVLTNKARKLSDIKIDPADPARLKERPNVQEAYLIVPLIDSGKPAKWQATVLSAVDDRGLLYACRTLLQLVQGAGKLAKGPPGVRIPICAVEDWPDLPERGLWGAYALASLPWLSERKMNLVETHATRLFVNVDGRGEAAIDPQLIEEARPLGIRIVPIITHLDQLRRTRLFERYPHVLGKGDPKSWPDWVDGPVCWSQADARRVLTDWVCSLAANPSVDAVTIWLSEAPVQCRCEECLRENQYVQEVRAALAAWEEARKARPELKLRILLTQGSYPVNDRLLDLMPREVQVIYYDGGRTYTSSHAPMIEPRLEKFVAAGGWLGVCPQLTASWRIVSPFSGAHFIRARMEEFINKGLRCLYGYATPGIAYWQFNVEAAAEWSWNISGRSTREFAAAWAVRQNIGQPELVADWSERLGPVSWDVYACGIPYPWFFGRVAGEVRAGRPIRPGQGPLAEIPTAERLAQDKKSAQEALALAHKIGHPQLINESQVILSYVEILAALPEITALLNKVRNKEPLSQEKTERLKELSQQVEEAGARLQEALWSWARTCHPDVDKKPPSRFVDTVDVCRQTASATVEAIKAALGK
ncbi:MAG: hypothetical protein NZ899_12580 [Thermoguttaceae bacterium]|nr:hypothetical protein [Thermoguttaceae bacterium]MDW8079936.1 hypothetical protein [Thermoguttaceae bacterium]